jgi:hypothetical protein
MFPHCGRTAIGDTQTSGGSSLIYLPSKVTLSAPLKSIIGDPAISEIDNPVLWIYF